MDIDQLVEVTIKNKYYGKLLTEKQQKIVNMYVDNNLSLAEVSEELNISRQAVKDALDVSLEALTKYENTLHFIARDSKLKSKITDLEIEPKTKLKLLEILEGE